MALRAADSHAKQIQPWAKLSWPFGPQRTTLKTNLTPGWFSEAISLSAGPRK
jgi:hypothetical protein